MPLRQMEASSGKEIFVHYHKQGNDSVESIQQRHRFVLQQPSLSEYAVSLPTQPADVSVVQPSDDRFKFFAKGRDFQPHWKQHKYTPEELHILETYEGSSRLPSNSLIYREWSSHHNYSSLQTIGWGIVALISLIIGVLTFGIKELCERFQIFYNPLIKDYIERGEPYKLFLYHAGMSCTFVAISAAICVFLCPWAAGSGIPEIICILNGTVVRNVLSFRTFACKIASVSFAVLSGLPLGFEGPLIHIGGMVGALLSRPASPSCGCYRNGASQVTSEDEDDVTYGTHPCCRYRDCEERHSLICLGAACGIASAFSAPISAILFVIEEISTHWSALLTWKAFVGCILARSATEVIRTFAVTLEKYEGFSFLEFAHSAVFYEKDLLSLNLLMVVPSVLIGVIGGFLGVIYILLNLKMAKFRRRILGKIQSKSILQAVKIIEPVCLALLCTFVIMGTLPYFKCKPLEYEAKRYNKNEGKFLIFRGFQCDTPLVRQDLTGKVIQTGEYHEAATLLFGSWEQMIRNLLSRRTPLVFSAPILFVVFIFFFFVSSWVSLTSIASGFLICQLAIGALYGRLLGVLAYNGVALINMEKDWKWLDPGAFAMLGAAAFLAGTARLPITSVVLMVEITNDINLCLLIMIVVMISKAIGDSFTHPLYHSIIEFKCIPFLELELDVRCHKKKINLDLFDISSVMASPVECIHSCESVQKLANILLSTNHCGFPVVQVRGDSRVFMGMITRMELTVLLTKTASFKAVELERECRERIRITYPDYSALRIKDTITTNMTLSNYSSDPRYRNVTVNLVPYLNTSAHSVRADMSLGRGYNMFRSLGLRHLVVTDHENQVVGMITRKDLMGFVVVSKLKAILKSRSASEVGSNEQTNE